MPEGHGPGGGKVTARRRLGVHARLDRVSVEADLADVERVTRRDPQLLLDEVDTGDHLGHGVLDLQARVHLDEEGLVEPVSRDEELDGARPEIADAARGGDRGLAETFTGGGIHDGRGRFLDHLLMPPLQGALALAEGDRRAVRIGEHLHLDVPGALQQPLEQQGVIAEGRCGDPAGGGERVGEVVGSGGHGHALAAPTGGRLDEQGVSGAVGLGGDVVVAQPRRREARHGRHVVRRDVLLGADLVAHHLERLDARADEDDAGRGAGAREAGVLAQEAVAGVHGIRPRRHRGGDHRVDVEVRGHPHGPVGIAHVGGVGIRVGEDGDRADAETPQRPEHPARDLTAVGDENGGERGNAHDHIRKRPKPRSANGTRLTTSRASPSIVRVSAGSITPSSHRRAVA